MNRTSIDWAQYSWNPVTGCTHGCDYCYARRMAQRFTPKETDNWDDCTQPGNGLHEIRKARSAGGPWKYGFAPTLHSYRLGEPLCHKKPSRIFVCSMADLFGNWVPDDWITRVQNAAYAAPQHQYLFLTKNPKRYHDLLHSNVQPNWWLGQTVTTKDEALDEMVSGLHCAGWHTWLSVEPLLEDVADCIPYRGIDWLVVGAMTGPGSKGRQPQQKWVYDLTNTALKHDIPVFHKESLRSFYWPLPLLRKYPEAMAQEVAV